MLSAVCKQWCMPVPLRGRAACKNARMPKSPVTSEAARRPTATSGRIVMKPMQERSRADPPHRLGTWGINFPVEPEPWADRPPFSAPARHDANAGAGWPQCPDRNHARHGERPPITNPPCRGPTLTGRGPALSPRQASKTQAAGLCQFRRGCGSSAAPSSATARTVRHHRGRGAKHTAIRVLWQTSAR